LERIDSDFLEKLIIKGIMVDKNYLVLVSSTFESNYFDDSSISQIFSFCKEYVNEYNEIPEKETIINSLPDEFEQNNIKEIFENIENIDYDIARNYKHLVDQTNNYLKEQAVKRAIIESVDIVEDESRRPEIREKIENALTKDIKIDLGLNYFNDITPRLRKIFTASDVKIPTFYPQFDEFLNGGFTPFTLSVLTARIHGFKSNTMANFAARQVMKGYNVVLMTLEMSQDAFAQRFDSIYSGIDINRMYVSKSHKNKLAKSLINLKKDENRGHLLIKQFPTGDASVIDFTVYLRELLIRGIKPSIIYVDYINLMKTAYKVERNMYSAVKRISEELRALSFSFEVPVISVSQLNREGSFVGFEELDFTYIAESLGLPATADFMAILGTDDDAMTYKNELLYKIIKNRLGGRVGEIGTLYYDSRNLRMYDSTELDMWIKDAEITGDNREVAPTPNHREESNRTRRRR
jgi:replicative DNA helicase